MRISFDLDDTLICYDPAVPREPVRVPWWARHWYEEPLRLGTCELMAEISRRGHDIWIYTTSGRRPKAVTRWLHFYGIRVSAVINADMHQQLGAREVGGYRLTKYPPAFDIALHIDDEGILPRGHEHVFRVVQLRPADLEWTKRVLEAVIEVETALDQR
jgi:hypothetical protein